MDEEKDSVFSARFLGEPVYRWAGFAIAATIFLFLWGRVIHFLSAGIEK